MTLELLEEEITKALSEHILHEVEVQAMKILGYPWIGRSSPEIRDWCIAHIGIQNERWQISNHGPNLYFREERDYILFKMRWL